MESLKSFKKAFLGVAVATGVLAGHAATNDARAVTFLPDPPVIDVGNVGLGFSRTVSFDVSWTFDAGESGFLLSVLVFQTNNGFTVEQTSDGCSDEGGVCTYDVEFAPFLAGPRVLDIPEVLAIALPTLPNNTAFLGMRFTGNGFAVPVPLPAAAPLLAGALGLLGFAGWRRRRKV